MRLLKSRFELFTAASLALHAGLVAGLVVRRSAPPSSEAGVAGEASRAGSGAAVAGETFDVPDLEQNPDESAEGAEAPPVELDGPSAPPTAATGETVSARPAARHSHGTSAHPAGAPPVEPPPPLYGAVGDCAAGDLVTSFKRLFPIGASYDPLWERVPVGFYAQGDVTFYLADDGSLTHATVSASAAPAFRTAILQTTTLMKHRLFTARGAATHLHMVVRVTDRLENHGAFSIDANGSSSCGAGST